MSSDNVVHQVSEKKFVFQENGLEAVLKYEEKPGKILDLYSTFVPEKLRGRGIAQKLARAALTYAKENHFKVIPSCWFVDKYLQQHKEYGDLL